MGGPKKPTLSQLEKRVLRQRRAEKGGETKEKSVGSVIPPSMEEVEEFIKTQPYVTPYILSEKFGIRYSIAKNLLTALAEKKVLRLIEGDSRLRIYAPVKEIAVKVEEPKAKQKKRRKKK